MKKLDRDLEIAKLRLKERDLALVIVKEGRVLRQDRSQGLDGFLKAIEKLGKSLVASSVADKIVGAAAAMLCVYSGVVSVFALMISGEGISVLENNKIAYQFEDRVQSILNLDKTDICLFEKLALNSKNPKEAYEKLKSLAESNSRKRGETSDFQ